MIDMAKVTYFAFAIVALLGAVTLCAGLVETDRQLRANVFGIYITKDSAQVLSGVDVIFYNVTSHEFTLTIACTARLQEMRPPPMGAFAVRVSGRDVLVGLFVPPVTSRSYPPEQVVITYPDIELRYGVMKIQMGYPWDYPPKGVDPRDVPELTQFFESVGKLVR